MREVLKQIAILLTSYGLIFPIMYSWANSALDTYMRIWSGLGMLIVCFVAAYNIRVWIEREFGDG